MCGSIVDIQCAAAEITWAYFDLWPWRQKRCPRAPAAQVMNSVSLFCPVPELRRDA